MSVAEFPPLMEPDEDDDGDDCCPHGVPFDEDCEECDDEDDY